MALSYKDAYQYQQNFATTSAVSSFGQIIAASAMPAYGMGKLQYSNSSGQVLQMGLSPTSGSVESYLTIPPTVVPVVIEILVPANNNIFLKAVSANATSGWLTLDFFI